MKHLRLIGQARRAKLSLAITALVLASVVLWRDQGIVLNYFPPAEPVGLAPDELGALVLGALLPAFALNRLSTYERLTRGAHRLLLCLNSLLIAALSATPVIVWVTAVRLSQPLDATPPLLPRVLSFGLFGLFGLILTLLSGPTWGPIASMLLFSGFLVAQNAFGAHLGWNLVSTGKHWHTNLLVDALVLVVAGWLTYTRAGVPRSAKPA